MFGRTPKIEVIKLEEIKITLLDDMIALGPDDPTYVKRLVYLERVKELESKDRQRFSRDQILQTVGVLGSILVIVAYEQKHVMASKGLGLVPKFKP